jgi:hypothetical protein
MKGADAAEELESRQSLHVLNHHGGIRVTFCVELLLRYALAMALRPSLLVKCHFLRGASAMQRTLLLFISFRRFRPRHYGGSSSYDASVVGGVETDRSGDAIVCERKLCC